MLYVCVYIYIERERSTYIHTHASFDTRVEGEAQVYQRGEGGQRMHRLYIWSIML